MTITQAFFAVAGLYAAGLGFLKYYIDAKIDPLARQVDQLKDYIDAKIDPLAQQVDQLVQYMVSHEGRISALEERTRK